MEPQGPVGGRFDAAHGSATARRFDSWKEIAAYFGRDVRTVRRWEAREALPVHRHHHRARDSVYAFQHELDRWLAGRSAPSAAPPHQVQLSPGRVVLLVGAFAVTALTTWAVVLNPGTRASSHSGSLDRMSTADAATLNVRRPSADLEVQEAFVLARHQLLRRTGYRQQARESLETVVRRAPEFAEAHALLAEAYLREAVFDSSRRDQAWSKAEAAARRALALDGDLAAAHTVLSRIYLLRDWNWTAAAAAILRAIQLEPESPDARSAFGLYLRSAGRLSEAIVERERALRADPLNPQWLVFLGDEYNFARRYSDAAATYHRALLLERDYRPAVASLADVYARMGRYAEAAAWQLRWLMLRGQQSVGTAFREVRQRDGARAAMEWLDRWNISQYQRAPDEHLWDLAYLHARVGNHEVALRFLERAYRQRDTGLLQARVDPDVDSLRPDPQFQELLKRIGPP
jgi:tetratricopeptide (TPR) repeat protein